jgi:P-type Mg2+ transporter
MPKNLFQEYAAKDPAEVLKLLAAKEAGLEQREVERRIKQFGRNELDEQKLLWYHIILRQFRSSFIYLLFGAAILAFILKEYIDTAMILIFITINVFLAFIQEYKSEKAIALLKQFIKVRSRVKRQGQEEIISAAELVPGDIVIIEAGDIIPADIRIISENGLTVDEETLTGESVPIKKIAGALQAARIENYEALNIGFSGTKVVGGRGEGVVFATGQKTTIGDIATLTEETKKVSAFEKSIDKFSKFILGLVLITLGFIFLANLFIKGKNADILELVLFSIALAVSVIPEALPVVTSVSMSQGAMRLAKQKVVVRRLSAIEDLGSVEILCTDKTGTLTENHLTVAEVYGRDKKQILHYAALANAFLNDKEAEPNNAFDLAVWEKISAQNRKSITQVSRICELPFTPERRRNSVLVDQGEGPEMIVRGATEAIFPLCKAWNSKTRSEWQDWAREEGEQGRRVIALAAKKIAVKSKYGEKDESGLALLGLVSFIDPVKPSTKAAIAQANKLNIRVKILTGDSLEVARSVGMDVGLIKSDDEAMIGSELEKLSHEQQKKAVRSVGVFARVSPQQKYQIISLLQEKYTVGYLGEGINDAPALRIANVSLVVDHASDIARETADIILLQQSLEVIITGIKIGRETFSNTVKYIKATLTSNFGNFYAIAAASLLINYLPMLPLQILLLNLLSDFPMIAVATDTVDETELRSPKSYQVKDIVLIATILGLVSTSFDFLFFGLFYRISPEVLHTNWFIGSILTELILLFSIRTKLPFYKAKRPSTLLLWLTAGISLTTILIPFTHIGQSIFSFKQPSLADIATILAIVGVYFIVTESVKLFYYRTINTKQYTLS